MVACTASFVMCSVHDFAEYSSTARIFLCSSAVSVHVSHACKKIDRTNACNSFSLDDRLVFLSLHMGFSFASAAPVCAALARNSVFEPSSLRELQGT